MSPLIEGFKEAILAMPKAQLECSEFRGETTFSISKEALLSVCFYARDRVGFDMLLDIATIDLLGEEPRFQVVYELYSLRHGVHLRIKTKAEENEAVPSLIGVWPAADWLEREAYDMMGIKFEGHPNLTRILMWEGYPYHPMRKDFPLQGKPSQASGIAFSEEAPLGGGPFVTVPTQATTEIREPRARPIEIIPESI
ncbi:MAG: NADH-quinone oxidoreductase subunit C [Verrucomicrobia bacterium]|nr:MAG: NADH-quinone oxidoreductase subunit C [Verrucomicrobiota bacterium]